MDSHEMARAASKRAVYDRLKRACSTAIAAISAARSGAWNETPPSMVEAVALLRTAIDEIDHKREEKNA